MTLADDPSAWETYERGREAEKAGHMSEAYLLYSQAAARDPKNQTYWLRSLAVRSRAALEANIMPHITPAGADDDAEAPPLPLFDAPTLQDKADARRNLPSELKAGEGTRDFDLNGDSKMLYQEVAKVYGLDCVFDGDFVPGGPIHFRLRDVPYRVALRGLEAATGTFIVPISGKLFMVVKDTPQKRIEVEPRVTVAVQLPEADTPQAFTAMITAVQQSIGIEKVSFDTQSRTVIMRDLVSKVQAARALFEDLLRARAQVMIELRFLQVSRNDMITYGIDIPTMFTLTPLTNLFNNQISIPQGIAGLLRFGGGKTLMGIGIMDPSLVAQMSKASSSLLLDMQLRSLSGLPATMNVGEKYPIPTSGYFDASGNSAGTPGVFTPPPSFDYEDLGLTLKVTPSVHTRDDVTLDVDAEFKVLLSVGADGFPVIGTRVLKSTERLRMGQWAMVAGLLDPFEARTIAGMAGVSRVPYLGPLLSTHTKTTSNDEILVLIRPYLLTPPPSDGFTRTYRLGSDTRPITPL